MFSVIYNLQTIPMEYNACSISAYFIQIFECLILRVANVIAISETVWSFVPFEYHGHVNSLNLKFNISFASTQSWFTKYRSFVRFQVKVIGFCVRKKFLEHPYLRRRVVKWTENQIMK